MLNISQRINTFVGSQQGCPAGPIGTLIGIQMTQQHKLETDWSIELLEIAPTDSTLEIGFGAGRAVQHMAAQARRGKVSGIDLSSTMVHTAKLRNIGAVLAGRVALQRGNVMSLPFEDEQFDKILSIHTFYFWPDKMRGISEIRRTLKTGGKLVLTLSTRKVGDKQVYFQKLLEDEIMPEMQRDGFCQVELLEGPTARGYNSVALVAVKKPI
jgi:ubiquinone/menaquinone biosynthesis C-methylase UbiE